MVSVERHEVCKKCGNTEGIYYIQLRTNEEWFVCRASDEVRPWEAEHSPGPRVRASCLGCAL